MNTYVTFMPDALNKPVQHLQDNGIPVINLDRPYGTVSLQFDPGTPDATIAYLSALVAEASALIEAIKAQQAGVQP